MRTLIRLALLVVLMPAIAGCLTSESLIKLNADGSGTIENVILVNEAAMAQVAGMMGGEAGKAGGLTAKDGPLSFDPETLKAQAAQLGQGVRFVSSEPMMRGQLKGARVVYAFDDVNTLRVQQDPLSSAGPATGDKPASTEPVRLKMVRQPNGNSLLTIALDEKPAAKSPANVGAPKAGNMNVPPEMQAMIATMFEGLRIAIDVEVNGRLVRTSSPFAAGPRVTVLEMDLGTLLKDQSNLAKLTSIDPGKGVADMIPLLKDVKGIKVNESPITIEFAAR